MSNRYNPFIKPYYHHDFPEIPENGLIANFTDTLDISRFTKKKPTVQKEEDDNNEPVTVATIMDYQHMMAVLYDKVLPKPLMETNYTLEDATRLIEAGCGQQVLLEIGRYPSLTEDHLLKLIEAGNLTDITLANFRLLHFTNLSTRTIVKFIEKDWNLIHILNTHLEAPIFSKIDFRQVLFSFFHKTPEKNVLYRKIQEFFPLLLKLTTDDARIFNTQVILDYLTPIEIIHHLEKFHRLDTESFLHLLKKPITFQATKFSNLDEQPNYKVYLRSIIAYKDNFQLAINSMPVMEKLLLFQDILHSHPDCTPEILELLDINSSQFYEALEFELDNPPNIQIFKNTLPYCSCVPEGIAQKLLTQGHYQDIVVNLSVFRDLSAEIASKLAIGGFSKEIKNNLGSFQKFKTGFLLKIKFLSHF